MQYSYMMKKQFTQYLHEVFENTRAGLLSDADHLKIANMADSLVWSIYWSHWWVLQLTFLVKLDIITSMMLTCRFNQLAVFVVFLNICCHLFVLQKHLFHICSVIQKRCCFWASSHKLLLYYRWDDMKMKPITPGMMRDSAPRPDWYYLKYN